MDEIAARYLSWCLRHPAVLTLLFLGMTGLMFLVGWLLFGMTVAVVVVVFFLLFYAAMFASQLLQLRRTPR